MSTQHEGLNAQWKRSTSCLIMKEANGYIHFTSQQQQNRIII